MAQEIFSIRFTSNGKYVKRCSVSQLETVIGPSYFVDIRTLYIEDDDVIHTRKGVNLRLDEFYHFVENMFNPEGFEVNNYGRVLSLKPTGKLNIFELRLKKDCDNEQKITLSSRELRRLEAYLPSIKGSIPTV